MEEKQEIIEIQKKPQKTKEELKAYRRNYYKNKYHNDEEYKKNKKEKQKLLYERKTKDCESCKGRLPLNSDITICYNCENNKNKILNDSAYTRHFTINHCKKCGFTKTDMIKKNKNNKKDTTKLNIIDECEECPK